MNSKEIIKRVIHFDSPKRIGLDFNPPNQDDIAWIVSTKLKNKEYMDKSEWGYYEEELKIVGGFNGEVRRDSYGNIYGRLEEKTKGECIKGALQDDIDLIDSYKLPEYDEDYEGELKDILEENKDKYLLGALSVSPFSTLRDLRRIDQLLMDTVLEKEKIEKLLKKIKAFGISLIEKASRNGFDGVIVYDDWGTQISLLMSPQSFRELFKPVYKSFAKKAHECGMDFFVHSCGYVCEIIEDFIEVGVDVLQFDQPELLDIERLGKEYGGRVTFWCPVDIQKVMQTGNKELIEKHTNIMIDQFKGFGGGFIAKDYPSWEDIDVKDEWANWAREIFIKRSNEI